MICFRIPWYAVFSGLPSRDDIASITLEGVDQRSRSSVTWKREDRIAPWENLPKGLKFVVRLCQRFKRFRKLVERATRKRLIKMARRADGTLGWYENNNEMRLTAF
ncbi:hypothetical protein GF325_09060 [Candidatus Bathyarchaeota archaeon]|nr:hypothetical protein [Candidatus Bathyarchaeota archaeon]